MTIARDESAPKGHHLWGWAALVVGALAVGFYWLGASVTLNGERGFPLDDSWIHLQFARNLAAGNGLSFNPGELVTGSTAPLWTALLAIFFWIPGDPALWTQLLGVALYLVSGRLVYLLGRDLELSTGLAALAAVLVLATDWMVWSALSGLEIPLFVVLSLWGLRLHLAERRGEPQPPRSLAILGLASLARPEGMLLVVLAALDRLFAFERSPEGNLRVKAEFSRNLGVGLLLAAALIVPVALFNASISNSMVPTTFGAKVGPGRAAPIPELLYFLRAPISIFFRSQPYMLLLAGAGALSLVRRLGTGRDRGLLPATWLVGLPLAYSVISAASGDAVAGNFGRYFFPLFPFVVLLGALGLDEVVKGLGDGVKIGSIRLPVRAIAVLLILFPTLSALHAGSKRYSQNLANVHQSDVRAARWLSQRVPPEAVLAVNDIGAFGYFLPNRVLDLAGIINPEARAYRFEASAGGRPAIEGTLRFLDETRPDYLVIFPEWFPELFREGSPFRVIESFEISNNITMGGSTVVVASTPWTRYPLASVPSQ